MTLLVFLLGVTWGGIAGWWWREYKIVARPRHARRP